MPVALPCVTVTGDTCTAVFEDEHFDLQAKPCCDGLMAVTCPADETHRDLTAAGWRLTGRTATPGQKVWTYERTTSEHTPA